MKRFLRHYRLFFSMMGGMTVLLVTFSVSAQTLFLDGFESGDRSATQNNIRWILPGGNISINSLRPRTGSYAMEFRFPARPDGQDSSAEQRIALGASYTDLWIKYDFYVPTNYYHRTQSGAANNKYFAIYRNPYTNPGFQVNFSTQPNGSGGSHLEIHTQDNGREAPVQSPSSARNFLTSADAGRWHNLILHIKVPTGPSTNDGVMQLWKNGTQIVNLTNLASWGGTGQNYMDEAYILGWSNSGYTNETIFYVDNFEVSNTPLGVNPPAAPPVPTVE